MDWTGNICLHHPRKDICQSDFQIFIDFLETQNTTIQLN